MYPVVSFDPPMQNDTLNTVVIPVAICPQALHKQVEVKQSTYKAVQMVGQQLLSQKSKEDVETLHKKLIDLEQKWTEVSKLLTDQLQKLERTHEELSKKLFIMVIHIYVAVCVAMLNYLFISTFRSVQQAHSTSTKMDS